MTWIDGSGDSQVSAARNVTPRQEASRCATQHHTEPALPTALTPFPGPHSSNHSPTSYLTIHSSVVIYHLLALLQSVLAMQSVLTQLARPASAGNLRSRANNDSPALSASASLSPTQPISPLSPLTLPSTASTSTSSLSSLVYSPQPLSPLPSPSSPPAIQHVFPSLPPTLTLVYGNSSYRVHPHLLSHHSPLFHQLLATEPLLASYRIEPLEQCTPDHVLLLLQTLYSIDAAVPESCSSLAVPCGGSSQLEARMRAHMQQLLALAVQLRMRLVVDKCDALLSTMLASHIKKGACCLSLLLQSLLLCQLYGLTAMRAECVQAVAQWDGRWWQSSEWAEVSEELSADSVVELVREMRQVGGKEREEGAATLLRLKAL